MTPLGVVNKDIKGSKLESTIGAPESDTHGHAMWPWMQMHVRP